MKEVSGYFFSNLTFCKLTNYPCQTYWSIPFSKDSLAVASHIARKKIMKKVRHCVDAADSRKTNIRPWVMDIDKIIFLQIIEWRGFVTMILKREIFRHKTTQTKPRIKTASTCLKTLWFFSIFQIVLASSCDIKYCMIASVNTSLEVSGQLVMF